MEFLLGKPLGNCIFGKLRRPQDNIKLDLSEIGYQVGVLSPDRVPLIFAVLNLLALSAQN
jgi:hypothetical protein